MPLFVPWRLRRLAACVAALQLGPLSGPALAALDGADLTTAVQVDLGIQDPGGLRQGEAAASTRTRLRGSLLGAD